MCGIIGGISERNVVNILLEGLSRLEYRGYDSVGIAVIDEKQNLYRYRVTGRVGELSKKVQEYNIKGLIGVGHTRWATHGKVTVNNAHPHFSNNEIAVIHNGIIENYLEIKQYLLSFGYTYESETDTEVIAHLIHHFSKNNDIIDAVKLSMDMLVGSYSIGVIYKKQINRIICAKQGSPLILGIGINEMFFASDIAALLPVTSKVVYLEDGDITDIGVNNYKIYNNHLEVNRIVRISELNISKMELGSFKHYMQKEIFEQTEVFADLINSFKNNVDPLSFGETASVVFKSIKRVQVIACGTSLNAGSVFKYWIEDIIGIECSVDIASEFRYRGVIVNQDVLYIAISQSGETADTISAIKKIQEQGAKNTLVICNVPESTLMRMCLLNMLTKAGPEVGVASTKAFTTQLIVLLYLIFCIKKVKEGLSSNDIDVFIMNLKKLPVMLEKIFSSVHIIEKIAQTLKHESNILFIGRNTLYPIAIEGSLKLKEVSYIHAEAYAAGELKHGPLALIDDKMPCLVLISKSLLADKTKNNILEILSRNGKVYLFTDFIEEDLIVRSFQHYCLPISNVPVYLLPILFAIPLQLLAYYTSTIKGADVDKPRNLAKSVTVE